MNEWLQAAACTNVPPQTLEESAVKNREIEIVVKFVVSAMSYQKLQ